MDPNFKWYHDRSLVVIFSVAAIQASFVGVELAVALATDSLSLLSDGLHNLGDVASLGLGGGALIFSKRAASAYMTFGWRRAQIVGGLINGVLIVGMQSVIALQALDRFAEPSPVEANLAFFITTTLSLVVNIVGAGLLTLAGVGHGHSHGGDDHGHSHGGGGHSHGGEKKKEKSGHGHSHDGEKKEKKEGGHGHSHDGEKKEKKEKSGHGHSHDGEKKEKKEKSGHGHSHGGSEKSALLATGEDSGPKLNENFKIMIIHLIGDGVGCIVVLITGFIIRFTSWKWKIYADAIGSLLISAIIFYASWDVIKEASHVLLQRVPPGFPVEDIIQRVRAVPGVMGLHEFHVWQLVDSVIVGSCHVKCRDGQNFNNIASDLKSITHSYGLHSFTIQPEFVSHEQSCEGRENASADCTCKDDEFEDDSAACEMSCAPDCKETEDVCCTPTSPSAAGSRVLTPRKPRPIASESLYGSV